MIKTLYPVFQEWSAKGSVYIISDTHFEDSDCRFMDSNWPSPEKYIEGLKGITKNDTLIHLGDVGNPLWLKDIPAYKVLIMGNHDNGRSNYERSYRKYAYDFPTLDDAKKALKSGVIDSIKFHPNKDGSYEGYVDNHLFDEVYEGPLFIAEKIVLSHEPICVTACISDEPVAFNIHGHDHSGLLCNDRFHLNCAANIQRYKPVNLKTIITKGFISDKNIDSVHRVIIDNASGKKK